MGARRSATRVRVSLGVCCAAMCRCCPDTCMQLPRMDAHCVVSTKHRITAGRLQGLYTRTGGRRVVRRGGEGTVTRCGGGSKGPSDRTCSRPAPTPGGIGGVSGGSGRLGRPVSFLTPPSVSSSGVTGGTLLWYARRAVVFTSALLGVMMWIRTEEVYNIHDRVLTQNATTSPHTQPTHSRQQTKTQKATLHTSSNADTGTTSTQARPPQILVHHTTHG